LAAETHASRGDPSDLLEATYRANPRYELVQFDRLPPAEQAALQGLDRGPDFYGLLLARGRADLGVKAVGRDVALLYLTMAKPGRLPTYVQRQFGDDHRRAIAELVLDGVLEVETDGVFVSGPAAHRRVIGDAEAPAGGGVLARRSMEALQYAQALEIADSRTLSARLYGYGQLPLSPELQHMFPTPAAVSKYLGVRANDATASTLSRSWFELPRSQSGEWWLAWNSRLVRRRSLASEPTYKLYVSPRPEAMRETFQTVVQVITKLAAPNFKVGADVYGLLRPDKLVVYFETLDEVQRASSALTERLDGYPAHGVPFTAEIAGGGLLSWAVDPPRDLSLPGWRQAESWRMWVTNRLAVALLSAKVAGSDVVEPSRFALDRLRLDGVDTTSWIPTPAIWRDAIASG
jgi:hypothetical protein